MRIVSDTDTFLIPFDNHNRKTIIVSNSYKNEVIDCLSTYFVSKKKTKCVVYDEEQIMEMNDINFIYLSNDMSYDNNFDFKAKTVLNNELSEIIRNNEKSFLSLNKIRDELLNLQTDKGIYQIEDIMSFGLKNRVEIEMKEFNINLLLQMLSVKDQSYINSEKEIILLNLLLYVNRNKTNVVFVDGYVDEILDSWINKQKENIFFLIDNEVMKEAYPGYNIILLSNQNHLIESQEDDSVIKSLSYMNHSFIQSNICQQNEKNIDIFNQYHDEKSTFFIKNSLENTVKA